MSYIKNLAAILHKAQGVIDPETRQPIDIGGEVLSIRQEADKMRARLIIAIDFAKRAGHLPGCEADRCAVCGMSELPRGVPLPKDLKGHSYTHDFQPGPCTCGHDRIVGSAGA